MNRVPTILSLYKSTEETTNEIQVTVKNVFCKIETSVLIKEEYHLQPSTSNLTNMFKHSKTTTIILENELNNLLINDTKRCYPGADSES